MDDDSATIRHLHIAKAVCCGVLGVLLMGCPSMKRWPGFKPPCVLDPGIDQAQLVAHLNRNIVGTPEHGGLVSWRSDSAKITVTGVPLPLPAKIAVESPRNLRILVSNPMTRGQEADIGSNPERFWFWAKDAPGIMTCKHEDVSTALGHMNSPIPVDPDWMMEVLGVIPIDNSKYTMRRPTIGVAELIAKQQTPSGRMVERVIRVDTCQGVITDHLLQEESGEMIASAHLDKYAEGPTGVLLPMVYQLKIRGSKMGMTIHLSNPETNPATLEGNSGIWNVPNLPGVQIVDIGEQARRAVAPIAPAGAQFTDISMPRREAAGIIHLEAPNPAQRRLPAQPAVANPFLPSEHRSSDAPAPFPIAN